MEKIWIVEGKFKMLTDEQIKGLDEEHKMSYIKALNEEALKQSGEALKVVESHNKLQKDFDVLKEEFAEVNAEMKAVLEEAKATGGKEKNKIIKFFESDEVKNRIKNGVAGFEKMKITPDELIAQTKAAALMSIDGVAPATENIIGADGFSTIVGNFIDSRIGMVPKPMNFILPLVNVINATGTENIWWTERINEEGDAEFIGEGTLKPLADAEWKTYKTDIKEVAIRWKMTNKMMMHTPVVVSNFRTHANQLVEQKIDSQIVNGDGLGNNLTGIEAIASAFIVPPQLAMSYRDANIFDAICAMLVSVELANFMSNVVILNTVWKAKMKGLKDTDGRYIVPPFMSPSGNEIAGVSIIFTNKLPDTDIIVGDLTKFNVVFAEQIMFQEGYENDDFSKNLTSFKLEAFLGTYIMSSDNGAILYDQIATVLTAIDDPLL